MTTYRCKRIMHANDSNVQVRYLMMEDEMIGNAIAKINASGVYLMMTSSNGNGFRVTGPLCGEFTGEFPSQRQVVRSLVFSLICVWINGWVNNREAGDLGRHQAHYDVIVMVVQSSLFTRPLFHCTFPWPMEVCNKIDILSLLLIYGNPQFDCEYSYVIYEFMHMFYFFPNTTCSTRPEHEPGLGAHMVIYKQVESSISWQYMYYT